MKKKIIINLPQYRGSKCSQGGYLSYILDSLSESHETFVVCSNAAKDSSISDKILFTFDDDNGFIKKIISYLVLNIKMFFFLLRRPDFLIINVSQENIYPFFFNKQICFIHDLIQKKYPRNYKAYVYYNYMLPFFAKRTLVNITPSVTVRDTLSKSGIKSDVIYRMYDRKANTFVIKSILKKKYTGVFIGTIAKHKNFDFFNSVAGLLPDCKFLAILPERDIARINVNKNITLAHSLGKEEYSRAVMQSEFIISPSFDEGFGPVFDALSMGTKALVSDIEVYRELFGKTAFFFNPDDPSECVGLIKDSGSYLFDSKEVYKLAELLFEQNDRFLMLLERFDNH